MPGAGRLVPEAERQRCFFQVDLPSAEGQVFDKCRVSSLSSGLEA